MTSEEFASRLACPVKAISTRLGALGMLEPCTRCCGVGRFSYCQRYGDTCFKCGGSGKQVPKLTAKLAQIAREKIDAGGLADYFATLERKRQAKARLPGLVAAARVHYSRIADHYEAAYKAGGIDASLFSFQNQANNLFSGKGHDGDWLWVAHPVEFGIWRAEAAAKRGELDVTLAAELIERLTARLTALADAFEAGLIHPAVFEAA